MVPVWGRLLHCIWKMLLMAAELCVADIFLMLMLALLVHISAQQNQINWTLCWHIYYTLSPIQYSASLSLSASSPPIGWRQCRWIVIGWRDGWLWRQVKHPSQIYDWQIALIDGARALKGEILGGREDKGDERGVEY